MDRFWPQPYEQLVLVLRRMGHERDARRLRLLNKERRGKVGNWYPEPLLGT